MEVEIRDSTRDDIAAIARLTYEASVASGSYRLPPVMFADAHSLREDFQRYGSVWSLVAEANGLVVAHVAFVHAHTRGDPPEPIPGLAHLWRMFVDRRHWGTGLAGDMLRRAHGEMRARGYTGARLFTPMSQSRARAFYEREGWRPTGVREYSEQLDVELVEYRCDL